MNHPGQRGGPPQHRGMSQRDIYRGELGQAPPGEAPKPPRCWSNAGTLTSGDPGSEVALQASFTDEPGNYTVQIGALYPNPQQGLNPIIAEATIRWSVAGNTVTRRVTVGQGVSISASAQAVTVSVKDVTNLLGTADVYNIIITVAPGVRPDNGIPPILYPTPNFTNLVVLGPANVWNVPIPTNSGAVAVQVTIADQAGGIVADNQVVVEVRAAAPINQLRICDPRDLEWIPIPPGATTIRVNNISAVPVFVTMCFAIDG